MSDRTQPKPDADLIKCMDRLALRITDLRLSLLEPRPALAGVGEGAGGGGRDPASRGDAPRRRRGRHGRRGDREQGPLDRRLAPGRSR